MTVIIQPGFTGVSQPLDHPRIGWRFATGAAISGGDAAGYPASNALDVRTALGWRPDAATGHVGVNIGAITPANYCGVAGHTLGSSGAVVRVQRWDGAAWVNVVGNTQIDTDDALMFLFSPIDSSQFRLLIESASAVPRIGHIRFGTVTEVPQKARYGGTTPISESRQYEYDTLRANNGAFLGRSIISQGLRFQIAVSHVSETWRRTEWAAFRDYANKGSATFFVADKPLSYPEDVAYAWSNDALSAERGIPNKNISGQFVLNCEAL
jgi:hypothetical protein